MKINKYFYITISDDDMSAYIHCTNYFSEHNGPFDQVDIIRLINSYKVSYGIISEAVTEVANATSEDKFPIQVAKGTLPVHGIDGSITFHVHGHVLSRGRKVAQFKELMEILKVNKGDKIATISEPIAGKDGSTVTQKVIRASVGKNVGPLPGSNVHFVDAEKAYYAGIDGEISIQENLIDVQTLEEITSEELKIKRRLHVEGSLIIHGDVTTNCDISAVGDIKIFGIVEAATVEAGGSVFVSEGFSGMNKGKVSAKANVFLGYMNQGKVLAGNNLYVENSIVHSIMDVHGSVYCLRGNIIGGRLTIGELVQAKDFGNRLSTETIIFFKHKDTASDEQQLLDEKKALEHTLKQLELVGENLEKNKNDLQARIMLLKQRNSKEKTVNDLKIVESKIVQLQKELQRDVKQQIFVKGTLFSNVIVQFGRYKQKINQVHHEVSVVLDHNEIKIRALKELHNGADYFELESS